MQWSKAVGIGLAMSFCACAHAQISLSSAVDLALRSNPRVHAAEANVVKARAALAQAHDAYVPSISATAGYGQGIGPPSGLPTVVSLSSQSLVFNFSQKDYIRAAVAGVQAATLSLQDVRDQVSEDVAITYLNLDNAQQRQTAIEEAYGFATRLAAIVQDRLAAGQDTQMEALRARRTAVQIHQERTHTEDEIAILSDHLSRLIGLPGNKLATLPRSIPEMPSIAALSDSGPDSYGIRSDFASARSKQETAFGDGRSRLRPQFSLGANYSYIDTSEHHFLKYYPGFLGNSNNAATIYIEMQFPIFDHSHGDHARETAAEASRAHFEAEDHRNQFLEGRFKLRHSLDELNDSYELAEIDRDMAQEQLGATLVQLNADAGDPNKPQMTAKDEQNARLQERQKFIDLLSTQFQLNQAMVNLMRQTGQLDGWLKAAILQPENTPAAAVSH